MNCQDVRTHLPPYVDGELGVNETLAVRGHIAECPGCRILAEQERQFRQLLRRQPQESAPPELRARIIARCRRAARRTLLRPWLVAPALAAAALVVVLVQPGLKPSTPLLGELVANHVAYSDIERPAEFASMSRLEVEEWFLQRAGLRATVPDYSPSGIGLVGGRIAQIRARKAVFILYEKGHTLLSVFMVPASGREADLTGTRVSYRGYEYLAREEKGYRTVSWADGQTVFGVVSMLDYEALLQCADVLRVERTNQNRL